MATLTEIRKGLDASDVTQLRTIAQLFAEIAASNPEIVTAALDKSSKWLAKQPAEKKAALVQLHGDFAASIADRLELK